MYGQEGNGEKQQSYGSFLLTTNKRFVCFFFLLTCLHLRPEEWPDEPH